MTQEEQIRVVKIVRSNCQAAIGIFHLHPTVVAEMVGMEPNEVREIWRIQHWYRFTDNRVYKDPFFFAEQLGLSAKQAIDGNFRWINIKTWELAQEARQRIALRSAARLESNPYL